VRRKKTSSNGSPPNGHLSKRELEIVKLLAEDLTSKEVAARLGIAEKTVNFHRHAIKKRLDVQGTVGMVRYAIRHGIIKA
jgi:DNA-binding CsgD family transcriptional regulator